MERKLADWLNAGWHPDLILISSLTSYWHRSIEKLLPKICLRLGQENRERTKIALYGNYPRFEPEHAATQFDADIAFSETVQTNNWPDFQLYIESELRPPLFYALDIELRDVHEHLDACPTARAHLVTQQQEDPSADDSGSLLQRRHLWAIERARPRRGVC